MLDEDAERDSTLTRWCEFPSISRSSLSSLSGRDDGVGYASDTRLDGGSELAVVYGEEVTDVLACMPREGGNGELKSGLDLQDATHWNVGHTH
jgi:hypothetical protein